MDLYSDKIYSKMVENAENALISVLDLKENEKVLIITDKQKQKIGYAFLDAAKKMRAITDIYILPPHDGNLKEIPDTLLPMIEKKDVIINAFEGYAEETPFRIKLIKKETALPARVGHCPGITEQMLANTAMCVDYKKLADNAKHLMDLFQNAKEVHITAKSGTDIILNIENRNFKTDVKVKQGTSGNLPCGEIYCAPVEDKGDGIIVTDGSIGDLGQVKKHLTLEVKAGKIISITSDDDELVNKIKDLTTIDQMASVVGELGIGLNPCAKITGNLLEDEKAEKTAHIAFGNNEKMPGGKNNSKTHRDFLFYLPTFEVIYGTNEKKVIIKDGKIVR